MKNFQVQFNLVILLLAVFVACKKPKQTEVEVLPISPSELTVSLVSNTQATLNWIDKSTNEAGFKVERKTGNGTFGVIATTSSDITTINDAGLTPNTTYTYRVYSFNNAGKSLSYTNEVTIATYTLPTVTTTSISDTTGISAVSGGNILSDGGSPVTARGIVWSTNPTPTVSLTTKTADGTGVGQFTSKIDGLTKTTKYYVRAYAINAAGTAYGNELTFTTLSVDLTTGLVAYYPFNGNANDESGNGNNGVINGPTFTFDKNNLANAALKLDGVNDFINVPSSSSLNMAEGQDFSVSFYFTPNQQLPQTGFRGIISKMFPTGGNNGANNGWQIAKDLNVIRFQSRSGISSNEFANQACPGSDNLGTINETQTVLYTFVLDRKSGVLQLYKNEILDKTFNCLELNGSFSNNYPLKIGVDREGIYFVSGILDEIRIYNRKLNQLEILSLSKK